jgi:alkylhydroperoxidase/carboxymuconolactone decarboxylase family protein YurZ
MLENPTMSLVAVGAAIAGGCRPCLEHALNRCLELGADPADIARAVEIGRMVRSRAATDYDTAAAEIMADFEIAQAPAPAAGCACSAKN